MSNEVFDLDALSKDDDFQSQLADVAKNMLKDGKSKGWMLDSISFPEPESNSGKTYINATSNGLFNSRKARFSATCDSGICTVSYISFFDPDESKLSTVY